jgi:hypothetical protein
VASAPSSDDGGSVNLSSSSSAAATPGSSTDFTVTNVEDARNAWGKQTFELRAETQLVREEWVAAINLEIRRATIGGGAAVTSASAPSAVVYTFASLDQELLGVSSPPADVINLGEYDDNCCKQDGFRELTDRELRLLAAKVHSSPNVKALNLSGNKFDAAIVSNPFASPAPSTLITITPDTFLNMLSSPSVRPIMLNGTVNHVAEALVKLTALERINLRECGMGAEGVGRLAEQLGKLTALQHLDLGGTFLSCFSSLGIESGVAWDGAMRGVCVLFLSRFAGNELGVEGVGRLAEPLGKLTALQHLNLEGTV